MKKCIYILEDNAGLRDVLEFLLREENYNVEVYQYAREFWQQMKTHTPDMIVLDIHLPDGNGLDICSKLKKNAKTHSIPVLMMSGNNYLCQVKGKCAAEDFINKPFDINDFAQRVEYYVH